MSYETFHIGVDEFGEEFEIRCRVTGSVDTCDGTAPAEDKDGDGLPTTTTNFGQWNTVSCSIRRPGQ